MNISKKLVIYQTLIGISHFPSIQNTPDSDNIELSLYQVLRWFDYVLVNYAKSACPLVSFHKNIL